MPGGAEVIDPSLLSDITGQAKKDLEASGVSPFLRKAFEGIDLGAFSPTGTR